MPNTRTLVYLICWLSLLARPLNAQCAIPTAYKERLEQLPTQTEGFALLHEQGLIYLELRCLPEARAAFTEALANSNLNPSVQALIAALQKLVNGYEAWNVGNIKQARSLLLQLSDESQPPEVNVQANLALAEMLVQIPDQNTWDELQPNLVFLADERGIWQARRYLMLYGLDETNAEERIRYLQLKLSAKSPVQNRLASQIILADVLRRSGHVFESWLLVRSIDKEVGRKALSPDLRLLYIRVSAGIASVLARAGDTDAQKLYQVYIAALGQLNGEK